MNQHPGKILLIAFLQFPLLVHAQDPWLKRGDKCFESGDIRRAREMYEWSYRKTESPDAAARLGKCYWKENNYEEAEEFFGIAASSQEAEPENLFLFASALMANEKYTEALEALQDYKKGNPYDKRTRDHMDACERYQDLFSDSSLYIISRASFNSTESDFSPVYYFNGILFASARRNDLGVVFTSTMTEHPLLDLYFTSMTDNGKWQRPRLLPGEVNTIYNEGPVCLSPDGKTMYFTRNNYHEGDKGYSLEMVQKLKIYFSEYINGEWTNITPIPFNSDEYAVGHPALSADGSLLYFVSDMPGGYGATDLYVSEKQGDTWGTHRNLGPAINTAGNEMFPFVHSDGTFYFSSDGRFGLGDLDIFAAETEGTSWKRIRNLGFPINSSKDDFGLVLSPDKKSGWISSNRGSDKNPEDNIYKIEISRPDFECRPQAGNDYCVVFFETGSIDLDTLPFTYEWDLGDGTFKRGLEVSHCYSGPGTYLVKLNVVDTIENVLFFNQATYEFVIEDTQQVAIGMPEAAAIGETIEFSGSETFLPRVEIRNWYWDFGDGSFSQGETASHDYAREGVYEISLGVTGFDIDSGFEFKSCRTRNIRILGPEALNAFADSVRRVEDSLWIAFSANQVKPSTPENMDTAYHHEEVVKPKSAGELGEVQYDVRQNESARFGVQVTNTKSPIPTDSSYFKGLEEIREIQDESGYSYVVGDKPTIAEIVPVYAQVVSLEFENPIVVAIDNEKIISGHDSTFFIRIPGLKTPITFSVVKGILRDHAGNPVEADIRWEDLVAGKLYTSTRTDPLGRYIVELPNGKMYGFYADIDSVYPVSDYVDLQEVKTHMTFVGNIEVVSIRELIESDLAVRINNIFFDFDKFELKPESKRELDRLARILIENNEMGVEIMGHTDDWGTDSYNQQLSQKRSNSVLRYLILAGYDTRKITAVGYGEEKPIISNKTAGGRKMNRRVEFRFVKMNETQ